MPQKRLDGKMRAEFEQKSALFVQVYLSKIYMVRNVEKRTLIPHVNSEGPDKRAHPCNLIWTFSVCRHTTVSMIDSVSGQRKSRLA